MNLKQKGISASHLSHRAPNYHHPRIFLVCNSPFYFCCHRSHRKCPFLSFLPLLSYTILQCRWYLKDSQEVQSNMSTEKILHVVLQGYKLIKHYLCPLEVTSWQGVSQDTVVASERSSTPTRLVKTASLLPCELGCLRVGFRHSWIHKHGQQD